MIIRSFKISIIFLFLQSSLLANTQYFKDGVKLFNKKNLTKAKFKFEQDIVFNPKNEKSYLYLAKIYKVKKNDDLEESYLNTVILLNPKNEEAILNLAFLKIRKSNYSETKNLIKDLRKVCEKLCQETSDLEKRLNTLLKK